MKKIVLVFLVALCVMSTGCIQDFAEFLVSDINGVDLSACVSGFSTCWELYTDNSELISGGFTPGNF